MVARATKVRLRDRRRLRSYLSITLSILLTATVLGAVAYAARLQEVTISSIEVVGAAHVSADAVRAEINAVLDETYALLIPKRMSYVVPRGAISAAVVHAFPVVANVEATRLNLTVLEVTLTERVPAALWCFARCFTMDAYGFIFDTERPGDFRTFHGLLGSDPIGSTFLDGGFQNFSLLLDGVEHVTKQHVVEVRLDNSDAFVKLDGGGEIRFARKNDDRLLSDLEALFSSKELSGRAFEYIELRFGPNATVKF